MKTLKIITLGMVLFFAGAANAQISVHLNLGVQPQWAPVGYDDTRYYYLPDVEAYYDVSNSMFIYYEGSSWVHRSYLPSRYRNYDLYNGYKVGMRDYHGNTPYYNHREYRNKYANGRNRSVQRTIGERPGRGNNNQRSYRESNQVNRGRGGVINRDDRRGDNSYDRRGNEKSNNKRDNNKNANNDRGRGNDNDKRK